MIPTLWNYGNILEQMYMVQLLTQCRILLLLICLPGLPREHSHMTLDVLGVFLTYLLTLIRHFTKVCTLKNNTKLNWIFLIKSSEIVFIFLPAFYLIMWLMTSSKIFEKITILKIWQRFFFWCVKTHVGKILSLICL